MSRFMRNGHSLILAYDQGLEHGPTDFNEKNVDPAYVIDIANRGGFDAFVCQKGIAENYHELIDVPLLLKVNGKTAVYGGDPVARQNCSVDYAGKLGASAIGYTIYIGSRFEGEMMAEFGRIEEEAHSIGLAAVLWIYPRGEYVKNDTSPELVAYSARTALELGADAAKIKYTGDRKTFSWAVKSAGKIPVYMAGGKKTKDEADFLQQAADCVAAGAAGLAVGRNVWQSDDPLGLSGKLNSLVIEGKAGHQLKTA
ncbi:MAG: aldolase [Candidatus Thermoplasmatota archaeon]|nr:aldolase [Candidatus Sysuiplasma jiujiangense]MBX8640102.1 aldolase [Candidatus Sysuiplasma jiujiangense]MBX8642076.1 aldolase [Candidatus Sysuiplasma jiujiangense]MCL4318049.1 aldolase [Candidatus Thermoplasmatota archaeon]MCL5253134.1 aldolase [Candidatus Thermoplasmatota archaeon]